MLPQSYEFSHGLCLNHFLQVWLIGNQRYKVPLFIYINWYDEVFSLVRGRKLIRGMICLMRSVKLEAEVVGIWTEDHWDVKRVN